jgi:hypothetical protein
MAFWKQEAVRQGRKLDQHRTFGKAWGEGSVQCRPWIGHASWFLGSVAFLYPCHKQHMVRMAWHQDLAPWLAQLSINSPSTFCTVWNSVHPQPTHSLAFWVWAPSSFNGCSCLHHQLLDEYVPGSWLSPP